MNAAGKDDTKLVASAEADSGCSSPRVVPAWPCRAFMCRHFVSEAVVVHRWCSALRLGHGGTWVSFPGFSN
jgi:hypothetical protein